ncbi:MAG: hypothetical protein M1333_00375 [Patescibacteria group bacterium]|nr:hypothetical protein [Patescibacteria group bacterium]
MKKIIALSAVAAVGLTGLVLFSNVAKAQSFGWGRHQNTNRMIGIGINGNNTLQARAQALGMSQQDLQNELNSGKTMADILQEKNLTLDQFHQQMEDQTRAYLQSLVSQGQITQIQADQRMQFIEQMHDSRLNGAAGYGIGMMGAGRGMMGGF